MAKFKCYDTDKERWVRVGKAKAQNIPLMVIVSIFMVLSSVGIGISITAIFAVIKFTALLLN